MSPTDTAFSVDVDNVTCAPRCTCSHTECRTTSERECVSLIDGVKSAQMCGSLSEYTSGTRAAERRSSVTIHRQRPDECHRHGGAFALHSTCLVNGSAVETTWLSPTQLSCLIDREPGSYDLSVSDGYASGVSTRIEVTSRVLVETIEPIVHVDDVVAASLSNTIDVGGASCTFDGNANSADIVDGTRIYCQSPSDEARAAVALAVGALPLRRL